MEISRFAGEQLADQIAAGREATSEVDPMRLIEQVVHRARAVAGVSFDVFESTAVTDKNNRLYTSGYMVSQPDYALNIPFERLPVGPNSTKPGQNFRVPVATIIEDTSIAFANDVLNADVYSGPSTGRALRTVADIQRPRR